MPIRRRRDDDDFTHGPALEPGAAAMVALVFIVGLPRNGGVQWWAMIPAAVCAAAALLIAWRRHRDRVAHRRTGSPTAPVWYGAQVVLAHATMGFVDVAVGGLAGNQRFVLLTMVVITASRAPGVVTVTSGVSATFTTLWSALLSGTSWGAAVTMTATFAVSTAAIVSILYAVLASERSHARRGSAIASLASAIARADTLEDLPDVLPLASDVLGGPPLRVVRADAANSTTVVASFGRPRPQPVLQRGRAIDAALDEQVLLSPGAGQATVLVVCWPSGWARRSVPANAIAVVRDLLSHLIERSDRILSLEHSTMTDPLTGVGNRRALGEWMQQRAQGSSLIIFDLDHFKQFNDTRGHLDGDELLRRFGALLLAHVREGDCAARLGGEEFCVALAQADVTTAERFVARVRQSFSSDEGKVTFSAGVSETDRNETLEEVLGRADRALYEAKRTGRNRTVRANRPEQRSFR